jgi:hypothetical protein
MVWADGAPWAKEGADLLGGDFQLDCFHTSLSTKEQAASWPVKYIKPVLSGDAAGADSLLEQTQESARGESAKKIAQLRGYLLNIAHGLNDYRLDSDYDGLRDLGARGQRR